MRTPPNERVNPDIAEETAPGNASGSERRCVLSGEVHPREELIRLAVAPDGSVHPDPAGKAPGRGAWITPDRAALESAMADGHLKRALMRAFKGGPANDDGKRVTLSYSDDLPHRIESALIKVLADRLGLELRGGNIVLGSAKIEEHARTGRIALLLHASDSSEDGRKKLDQAWRVGMEKQGSGERGTVLPLDRDALSVALGRENVVHLGVSGPRGVRSKGPSAADRVGQAAMRLSRFMGSDPPD
ncbi:transcription terminating nucleic-acid-binding protein [Erythrobacter sp. NAP1]|uniref:DUF448 domain-containing protein n=1 Tax=Erythrobacter sp. NAP1 TaxID=237727 RepID=UPI0000685161|nr:DUF448 domain-containing protein [Erythrobacter sp. NAP1]EAQ27713.1 transcription terminating nucleic-acid-binding protein [Erythrobacter sp. NAP1]